MESTGQIDSLYAMQLAVPYPVQTPSCPLCFKSHGLDKCESHDTIVLSAKRKG